MIQIEVNNDTFKAFAFYTCLMVAKTLFMELLLFKERLKLSGVPSKIPSHPTTEHNSTNEKIERIKRAHLNDIENIPIFIAISLIYLCTKPDLACAVLFFRIFAFARIIHTFVYAIYVIPQPARATAFIAGEVVTWIMIFKCILYFYE